MRLLAILCVAAFVLAGCASTTSTPSSSDTPDLAIDGRGTNGGPDWVERILGDHDGDFEAHRDWTKHTGLSTPNFIELAHDPLAIAAFEGASAGGYFCGGQASTDDGRAITVISSFDTSVAFVVVDTTDPLNPIHLGDYILDNAQTYDVDITPDGKHVAIAANVGPMQPPPGGALAAGAALPNLPTLVNLQPKFRDACTGEVRLAGPDQTFAAGPSTILVSLADPTLPTFEDLVPNPIIGPHSVSTAIVDGTTYVAASITNLAHPASYYIFYQLTDLPSGTKLQPIGFVDSAVFGATAVTNGHVDAEISKHPVTGQLIAYLSDWDGGLVIVDLTLPQLPRLLSAWSDTGVDGGQVHSTRSVDGLHNGRHYLLVGQEFIGHPANRPSGWVYVLDDTDPTNVFEVGRWTLPIDVEMDWMGIELYSTHYFRLLGDTLFVAMYHGGIWAVKLDFEQPENMKLPPTVGAFVPDRNAPTGREPTGTYDFAPFVLDIFPYPDGTLVIYDGLSGVYVVKYDPSRDMAPPAPWPAEGRTL